MGVEDAISPKPPETAPGVFNLPAEELNLQSTLIKRGRPRKYPES